MRSLRAGSGHSSGPPVNLTPAGPQQPLAPQPDHSNQAGGEISSERSVHSSQESSQNGQVPAGREQEHFGTPSDYGRGSVSAGVSSYVNSSESGGRGHASDAFGSGSFGAAATGSTGGTPYASSLSALST